MTTVTQADREAAADIVGPKSNEGRYPGFACDYREGRCDTASLVQAFARYREAAFEAGAKATREVLDALSKAGPIHSGPVGGDLGRKYPDARQCVIEFAPGQGSGAYDLHSALVSLRAALDPAQIVGGGE